MGDTSSMIAAAQLAAGATTAYSQVTASRYSARVQENNARIADMQAADALARGKEAEAKHRRDVKRLIGRQRAAAAASGVVVDSGSAGDLVEESRTFGELDALQIRNNARREAWGFRVSSADSRARAALTRFEGYSNAFGTIATTGARVADRR